jgi:hypothetical protein
MLHMVIRKLRVLADNEYSILESLTIVYVNVTYGDKKIESAGG